MLPTSYMIQSFGSSSNVITWDGSTWSTIPFGIDPQGRKFYSIDGLSPTDIWVGTDNNGLYNFPAMYYWNGYSWTKYELPFLGSDWWDVTGVWSYLPNNVYAVLWSTHIANSGQFVRWNGSTWSLVSTFSGSPNAIDGLDDNHVYIVGHDSNLVSSVWFWNGSVLQKDISLPFSDYGGVAVYDSNNVYIYNKTNGTVYKGKYGGPWVAVYTIANPTHYATGMINNLCVNKSNGEVWMVTYNLSTAILYVHHFNGVSWAETSLDYLEPLGGVHFPYQISVSKTGKVLIANAQNTMIWRPYYNGSSWSLTPATPGGNVPSWGVFVYDSPNVSASVYPDSGLTTGGEDYTLTGNNVIDTGGNDTFSGTAVGGMWITQTNGSGSVSQSNRLIARSGLTSGSKAGLKLSRSVIETDASIQFVLKNNMKKLVTNNTVILSCYEINYDNNSYGRIFLSYSPKSIQSNRNEEFKIIVEIKKSGTSAVYFSQDAPNSILSEIYGVINPIKHLFRIMRIGSRLIFQLDNTTIFDDEKGKSFLDYPYATNLRFYVDNQTASYNVVTDFYNHHVNTLVLFGDNPSRITTMVTTGRLRGLTPPVEFSGVYPMTIVPFASDSRIVVQDFMYSFPNEFRVINQPNSYLSIVDDELRNPMNVIRGTA